MSTPIVTLIKSNSDIEKNTMIKRAVLFIMSGETIDNIIKKINDIRQIEGIYLASVSEMTVKYSDNMSYIAGLSVDMLSYYINNITSDINNEFLDKMNLVDNIPTEKVITPILKDEYSDIYNYLLQNVLPTISTQYGIILGDNNLLLATDSVDSSLQQLNALDTNIVQYLEGKNLLTSFNNLFKNNISIYQNQKNIVETSSANFGTRLAFYLSNLSYQLTSVYSQYTDINLLRKSYEIVYIIYTNLCSANIDKTKAYVMQNNIFQIKDDLSAYFSS